MAPNLYRLSLLSLVLVSILFLSGCGVINALRMRYANTNIEPVWPEHTQEVRLETYYISDKPYIKAKINDEQELLFLIDTGASFTILMDSSKSQAVPLEPGFDLPMRGWGEEEESKGFQSKLDVLEFGGIRYEGLNIAYLPASKTKYFLSEDEVVYDGIIGHDVLRHFAWTFDRSKGETIVRNRPHVKQSSESELDMDVFMLKPSIPVEVHFESGKPIPYDVIIDTGSRHYFKLSTAYMEKYKIKPERTVSALDFGLSGAAKHQRFALPKIKMGDNEFNHVKANIIKGDDEDDWWVVGNALLSKQTFTIDYIREKFYLAPAETSAITSRFNLLGLELRKTLSGSFIVRHVFPELPAQQTGIRVGDRITAIDGIPSKQMSENDWLDVTNTPGKHEICVDAACWQVNAKHIKGYSIQ